MDYTKLTLGHKVFKVHVANKRVIALNIIKIELVPAIDGRTEELVLKDCAVILVMRNGTEKHAFKMNDQGTLIDEDKVYFFNIREAEEECQKLK